MDPQSQLLLSRSLAVFSQSRHQSLMCCAWGAEAVVHHVCCECRPCSFMMHACWSRIGNSSWPCERHWPARPRLWLSRSGLFPRAVCALLLSDDEGSRIINLELASASSDSLSTIFKDVENKLSNPPSGTTLSCIAQLKSSSGPACSSWHASWPYSLHPCLADALGYQYSAAKS